MILRESGWLAGAGVLVGVAAAMALTRLVKSMLYGVQPWDPATMAAAGCCCWGWRSWQAGFRAACGGRAADGSAAARIKQGTGRREKKGNRGFFGCFVRE